MDISKFTSILEMKEIQVFFIIIVVGLLIYIVLVLGKPVVIWVANLVSAPFKRNKKEKKTKSALKDFDYNVKHGKKGDFRERDSGFMSNMKKWYNVETEEVQVEEKPIFSFSINKDLIDRMIFLGIIVVELILIVWKAMR
ncbi:MAG: hypothetical protein ABII01_00900 [Candidatus Woesearchaeota archaeon]